MPKIKINSFIRTLVLSDFFLFFSVGLLSPIYAVFILDRVDGGSLEVIGLATAFYWMARVFSAVPLSRLMDKIKGEKDEYILMVIGSAALALSPLFYIYASSPWHIYCIQVLNGIAFSMVIPAWRIIFMKHLDRGSVGFEWSLDDVGIGVSTAASATLGAFIAESLGFNALFVFISIVGLISTAILLLFYSGDGSFARWLFWHKKETGK